MVDGLGNTAPGEKPGADLLGNTNMELNEARNVLANFAAGDLGLHGSKSLTPEQVRSGALAVGMTPATADRIAQQFARAGRSRDAEGVLDACIELALQGDAVSKLVAMFR
jgi:hypothetical protein